MLTERQYAALVSLEERLKGLKEEAHARVKGADCPDYYNMGVSDTYASAMEMVVALRYELECEE